MTNNKKLIKAGQAAFGRNWQTELSERLNVNSRTVRHWVSGRNNVKEGVIDDVKLILLDRIDEIKEAKKEIEDD